MKQSLIHFTSPLQWMIFGVLLGDIFWLIFPHYWSLAFIRTALIGRLYISLGP